MTYTAGSLFSGIGGIDVAFAAAGFDIRFQVEIDDYCRKVLSKHAPRYWPNATQHVDIRDVGRAELGTVDVLFGGFPCQDISIAGKGAGLAGARSGLWYEFARLIGEIRPRFVFLENVPAITHRGGTDVIGCLASMGYDARWGIVPASDTGATHDRPRWWCVADAASFRHASAERREIEAYSKRVAVSWPKHNFQGASQSGREPYIGSSIANESRMARSDDGLSARMDGHRWPARPDHQPAANEPARQLVAKGTHWTSRVKALGNAVVPQVVYPFAVEIMRQLAEAESHGD